MANDRGVIMHKTGIIGSFKTKSNRQQTELTSPLSRCSWGRNKGHAPCFALYIHVHVIKQLLDLVSVIPRIFKVFG